MSDFDPGDQQLIDDFQEEVEHFSTRMEEITQEFTGIDSITEVAPILQAYQEAGMPYGDSMIGAMRYQMEKMMLEEVIAPWGEQIRNRHRDPNDLPQN